MARVWDGPGGSEPAGDVEAFPYWHDLRVTSGESANKHGSFWSSVDDLIDRAPSEDDLRSHRLQVLAARRFRALGRPVPEDFAAQERFAAIASMTAPIVLERTRAAFEGPAILIKGPEVANRYPDPGMRWYGDLDLIVADVDSAHRSLLSAGFGLVGDPELYVGIHHLRPVLAAGMPLPVEVHSRPKWFGTTAAPRWEELLEAAVPSTTGVEGVLTLPPAQHALLLAVHSWAHEPLRRLHDLIDIAAMMAGVDVHEVDRLASAWGVGRLWKTTHETVHVLFAGGTSAWSLRLWAQNLSGVRERTVFENHLQRWMSDFAALPLSVALRRVPQTFLDEIRPGSGEGWNTKLARTTVAIRNRAHTRSQHERDLIRGRSRGGPTPPD